MLSLQDSSTSGLKPISASADREQTMIAVEVKFLETSKNPNCDLGIDWTGTLWSTRFGAGISLTDNYRPN